METFRQKVVPLQHENNRYDSNMNTKNALSIATMALAALLCGCNEDDSLTINGNSGNNAGGTSTGTEDVASSTASEVLGFSVAFETSDKATYLNSGETVPTDSTDADFENYVENFTTEHTIYITYNEGTATIEGTVEGVTINATSADVAVSSSLKGVTYVLSGNSSDGSFRMENGTDDKKFRLILKDLSLTKVGAPAINIQPSKRCYLQIQGTNSLADSGTYATSDEDRKGCIFSEGKLLISGSGTLSVTSETKHAICSDDFVWIHDGADLTLESQAKDGIHANDSVVVSGGYVSITTSDGDGIDSEGGISLSGGLLHINAGGDTKKGIKSDTDILISGGKQVVMTSGAAVYDSTEADYSSCSALKADGNITISGGHFLAQSTGTGGKGIKADGQLTISGGTIEVATTGKRVGSGNTTSSPKGIKADGLLTISGGNVAVRLSGTGDGTEGIESKSDMYITGGCTASYSYDDAINAAGNLYIQNGYIYAQSLNNDAIDANKNLYLQGGNTMAIGAGAPENPLDAAEGYSIYVQGGNVLGVGGSTAQTASSSSQASIVFNASVSGKTLGLFDQSGNGLFSITVPSTSNSTCYMTANGMTANASYTVKSGVSVSGGTTWCGINAGGTLSGGSSLTTATASASVGTGMGGGGGQPGGGGPGRGGW